MEYPGSNTWMKRPAFACSFTKERLWGVPEMKIGRQVHRSYPTLVVNPKTHGHSTTTSLLLELIRTDLLPNRFKVPMISLDNERLIPLGMAFCGVLCWIYPKIPQALGTAELRVRSKLLDQWCPCMSRFTKELNRTIPGVTDSTISTKLLCGTLGLRYLGLTVPWPARHLPSLWGLLLTRAMIAPHLFLGWSRPYNIL